MYLAQALEPKTNTMEIAVEFLRMSLKHIYTSWFKNLSLLKRNQLPIVDTYSFNHL